MSLSVDIEKRLGDFHLAVQLHTERDLLALLGASGAGKSLCLRCIAGLETPDRGRIVLNGRVLYDSAAGVNQRPQARRVGYLFQSGALFPHLSALGNVTEGLTALPRRHREAEARALLERFHLTHAADRLPARLSGGERQRVALARSLAAKPELLLLDEPFSALDDHLKWDLELSLRESLRDYGGEVVLVTHSLEEVCRLARQVCVLDRGSAQPIIPVETLLRQPPTPAAARLAGVENLSPVIAAAGGLLASDWGWQLPAPVEAGVTHLGIRAEALTPAADGFPCRVEQCLSTAAGRMLLLRTPGGGLLRMRPGQEFPVPEPGAALGVTAAPQALLPLKGGAAL